MLHPSYRSENSFAVLCTNQSLFITNAKVRWAPCGPGGVCTVTLRTLLPAAGAHSSLSLCTCHSGLHEQQDGGQGAGSSSSHQHFTQRASVAWAHLIDTWGQTETWAKAVSCRLCCAAGRWNVGTVGSIPKHCCFLSGFGSLFASWRVSSSLCQSTMAGEPPRCCTGSLGITWGISQSVGTDHGCATPFHSYPKDKLQHTQWNRCRCFSRQSRPLYTRWFGVFLNDQWKKWMGAK